jgi:gliding motility-associated-like protein
MARLIVFFFMIESFCSFNQIHNSFKGDLIGIGWNNGWSSALAGTTLNVDCSSCINAGNAYLICIEIDAYNGSSLSNLSPTSIKINGVSHNFSNNTRISDPFLINPQNNYAVIHLVKSNITLPASSFTFEIPSQPDNLHKVTGFYLIIECVKDVSLTTSYEIVLNTSSSPNLTVSALNPIEISPINLSYNVGFSIVGHTMNFMNGDASNVSFNDDFLGKIAGQDLSSGSYWGSGVRGHFYYGDGILLGLDDDIPNLFMNGTDALAEVATYFSSNNQFHFSVDHEVSGNRTNYVEAAILTYTTPCDTFSVTVPNDTTICAGVTLQLNASGGQIYQWSASVPAALNDLSCTDCPNPIFSGETSRFYTVRIRNNDSCSVVRPVKINVRPRPLFGAITTTPSECGASTGSISLNVAAGTSNPVSYTLNDTLTQSSGLFSNLAAGNYTLSFTDGNGCLSLDTVVTVSEVNSTVAQFTVSPGYGTVPLMVNLNNTSQNATDFLWSVNGIGMGALLESYTCDPSGVYTIELIAWQYDPSCADTFSLSVTAVDRLIIPTAFTPDGDGVNDFWELPNIDAIYPENSVVIFNRWGSVVYESEKGKYALNPWRGDYEGKPLPVGTYYFIIQVDEDEEHDLKGSVTVVR